MAVLAQAAPRRTATPATAAAKAPGSSAKRPLVSSQLQQAGVSSILSGKRLYRMSDGKVIELPKDMTAEEAANLEAEAKTAQQKLGKGPPPKPVPEVRKPADKSDKKDGKKAQGKGGKGGVAGRTGPRTVAVKGKLKAVGGTVARFLLGKAAPVLSRGIGMLRSLSRNEQTHDNAAQKLQQAEKAVATGPGCRRARCTPASASTHR